MGGCRVLRVSAARCPVVEQGKHSTLTKDWGGLNMEPGGHHWTSHCHVHTVSVMGLSTQA